MFCFVCYCFYRASVRTRGIDIAILPVTFIFFYFQKKYPPGSVVRCPTAKNRRFHVPQPTFLFPLETPLRLSRNMLHGWKDNSMLAKPLAARTYLSSIVSELCDA